MQINFTFQVILIGAVIVLGIFAALGLFLKKENPLANKLMATFLLVISLWLCDAFMRITGIYGQNANYYFKPIYYSFAFGPLLYYYVRSIVNSDFRFKRIHLLHFTPVILQAALYLFLSFKDYTYRHWYWEEVHLPYTYRLEFDGTFISMAIYLFFSIRLLKAYHTWLKDEHSDHSTKNLKWLTIILILMFVLCVQWFVEIILRDVYDLYYSYDITPTILGVFTLILAYRAFFQEDQKEVIFSSDQTDSKRSAFQFDQAILDRIVNRMEVNEDFLDSKLSLKEFASRCKLPQKTVSQYLNQKLDKSFHDFVNGYRIESFKKSVITSAEKNMTLEGLAYDCGFNSKATFNRIFKRNTGMTPSQYVSKQA